MVRGLDIGAAVGKTWGFSQTGSEEAWARGE